MAPTISNAFSQPQCSAIQGTVSGANTAPMFAPELKMPVAKERSFRKDGGLYEVSPYALTWDDENYYMVAYDSDAKIIKHLFCKTGNYCY